MTTAQVKRLREAYRQVSDTNSCHILSDSMLNTPQFCLSLQDLNHVLVTIKKAKPDSHLALAGPGLLGEGPLFPLIDFKGETTLRVFQYVVCSAVPSLCIRDFSFIAI